jgi:uncharacterized protein (TIGR02217 family)
MQSFADAAAILSFFEERQGRRFAFAFRDPLDESTGTAGQPPAPTDEILGSGDGVTRTFRFHKTYGETRRTIALVREATLRIAIDGEELAPADFALSEDRDEVILAQAPLAGASVSGGFLFDVPVRFDTDELDFLYGAHGVSLPELALAEVRL